MVKQRSVGLCVVLTIITCGIYGLYWMASLTDEVGEVTNDPGISGVLAVILSIVTCGIYGIYWGYKMGEKLDFARARNNVPSGSFPILFLLLNVFGLGIVTWALIQGELNRYSPVM